MANHRLSGYQYETSPKKLEPNHIPQRNPYSQKKSSALRKKDEEKQSKPKQKRKLKSHIKMVMCIGFVFSILFAISYRNSLINENFNKLEKLKQTLAVTKKENEQLQVSIENNLNLANVEKKAKQKLGMQKLDSSQKAYVSLPKKDYVQPAVEEVILDDKELTWLQKIMKLFLEQ